MSFLEIYCSDLAGNALEGFPMPSLATCGSHVAQEANRLQN